MRALAQSTISFLGAMTALGVQQVVDLLGTQASTRPQSTTAAQLDAVTGTAAEQLDASLQPAFHAGCQLQNAMVDTAFNLLPVDPQGIDDLVLLPADLLNFVQATGQIVPSSICLASAMVDPLMQKQVKQVVEFGPGTGVMTRELLKRLSSDARLLAFEINPRFVQRLRQTLPDPRLRVIEASAETIHEVFREERWSRVDGVVSSLGLTLMPDALKNSIFQRLMPYLDEHSVLTQFQYLNTFRISDGAIELYDTGAFLGQFFHSVTRQVVWLNLPPASVYICQGVKSQPEGATR